MKKRAVRPVARLCLGVVLLLLARGAHAAAEPAADGPPAHLILALDGIPFDVFDDIQREGHFARFHPVRRMVSTFPSLSDVAFSAIAGSGPPASYQVVRFDREQNRVTGNSLGSLSSRAHRHMPADTGDRSGLHRVAAYLSSYRTAKAELRDMREKFLASRRSTFVAYIEATDPMVHVHGRGKTERFLRELDPFLEDLTAEVRRRTGRELRIDIVSDHGSTLERGRRARIERTLESCGFRHARSLARPEDVVYTQAGIIGSVALACQPGRAEPIARCLLADPAVDLAAFVQDGAVVVVSRGGEAALRALAGEGERYAYEMRTGDPLVLAALLGEPAGTRTLVASEERLFRETLAGPYPDAPRRLWRAFHGAVREPAEVLVSLHDGYEAGNPFLHFLATLRGRKGTHGSLTRSASLGVLASNWRTLDDADAWTAQRMLFGQEMLAAAGKTDRLSAGAPVETERSPLALEITQPVAAPR